MTQTERNVRFYRNRKENALCPVCGKPLDRDGHYCMSCLEKANKYKRETRQRLKELGICPVCRKNKLYGEEKQCVDCQEKAYYSRRPISEEQRIRYNKRFSNQQRLLYKQRKEQGICTRCGKFKAEHGKVKCAICLAKNAEMKRNSYQSKEDKKKTY